MFFTLFYMYSTFVQWWRLGTLRNKLWGTLNGTNALLVCSGNTITEPDQSRCLENLLYHNSDKFACTVTPRLKVNLKDWAQFPKHSTLFPIHFRPKKINLIEPKMYLLIRSAYEKYFPHQASVIEIETFGELVAWKLSDHLDIILKTDMSNVTKLVHWITNSDVDINHEMKIVKIETVDVDGMVTRIKYDKIFSTQERLRYSVAERDWAKFTQNLKDIYSKVHEKQSNPKITIENGAKAVKVPVSEVKPIKKESKRENDGRGDERRDTLEVHNRKKEARQKYKPESSKPKEDKKRKVERHHRPTHKADVEGPRRTSETKSKSSESRTKSAEPKNITSEVQKFPFTILESDDAIRLESTTFDSKVTDFNSKVKSLETVAKTINASNTTERDCWIASSTDDNESRPTPDVKEHRKYKKRAGTLKKMNSVHDDDSSSIAYQCKEEEGQFLHEGNLKFPTQRKMCRKNSKTKRNTKPPNVLVFADSIAAKENVKAVLGDILNDEKYTIYDLPTNKSSEFWDESTILVIICGNVTPNLTHELLQYLVNGGQLLCLCSDLLYSVLHTYSTAEVREHELVRFSYGDWKRVKMMHHIFCYQASPAKKQFSKDSDQSNHSGGEGSSPIAPRTPSAVEFSHNGKNYTVQVQVLGTEETWQTPSLLLANVKGTSGRAIFSQVHLEVDPTQYQDDESKYEALKDSNQARLEILRHILTTHLDVDCSQLKQDVVYSPGYFLGRHDMKLQMLKDNDNIAENRLVGDKLTLVFCWKDDEPGPATSSRLPIMVLSCPSNFSTVQYFETLQTETIGRLVIYSDVLSSSQHALSGKLLHGLVVIPRQQTQGVGRSTNVWLSPPGCAMFSLQLHISMQSTLGKSLPLIQHLVMVGIVSAIRSIPGNEDLEINLKWPNDLYAYSKIKIAGLVINSEVFKDVAIVNIGCGVNLDNGNPTTCINAIIAKYNEENGTNLQKIVYEKYFALVFNEVERILNIVEGGNLDYFYELYYKYWLHSESEISVRTEDKQCRKVTIMGIDQYGYLSVKSPDGTLSNVQPDGNTFDMLKGLIAPKIS